MKENSLVIKKTKIEQKIITNYYEVYGEWKQFFLDDREFVVEYSCSIGNVNPSIANIPFITNILPMAWLFDAELFIEEIDDDFFQCLPELKSGYMNMYPDMKFKGKVSPKRVVVNEKLNIDGSACMFSGGADAFHTMISHLEEKPDLVAIWGADVKVNNTSAWEIVESHIAKTAKLNKLNNITIKSYFRAIIKEEALSEFVLPLSGDNWWHGFQHGIGLLGHVAPYAYEYKVGTIYIASSFTEAQKGQYTCASDPMIDNQLKFCGCSVIHDGYNYTRQEKINHICKFSKNNDYTPNLRVCWCSKTGGNCCSCEKCIRTILAIYAEKQNPQEYGFEYSDKEFKGIISNFRYKLRITSKEIGALRYAPIQNAIRRNYSLTEVDKRLKWFYNINIDKIKKTMYVCISTLVWQVSWKLKSGFRKK